jgi:glycosyltransferase involved in cell wall biosynthesis
MRNQPFVSVLLPVYNGEKYINEAITSIINQLDQDYELIISIDSGSDTSESVARKFEGANKRVKVFTHTKRLGMRGNYEFLISKSNGSWLTIIGQDDAMMPFAISELRRSFEKVPDMSALVSRRAYAFWPDTNGDFGRHQFIYPIGENRVSEVSSNRFLLNCLKSKSEYSQGPQLYTGSFISRKVVLEFSSKQNGELFPYPIPDVSSSASILLATKNFHYSNLPLFIVGTSGSSTGALIDKSLKSIDASPVIQKLYLEAFNGDSQKFEAPGLGIFSTFSWYLFEAVSQISSSDQLPRLKFNPTWALAALRVENRKKVSRKNDARDTIYALQSQLNTNALSLQGKIIAIRLFKLRNLVQKYLNGLVLFIQHRLILESSSQQFDLIQSIEFTSRKANNRVLKK